MSAHGSTTKPPTRPLGAWFAAVLIMLLLTPLYSAFAQGFGTPATPQTRPSNARAISAVEGSCTPAPNQVVVDCDCYPGLANRLVGCIRQTLHNASSRYFDPDTGIHASVARGIAGLITLGVVIYGIMIVSGMVEKLGRDTFILLIKIALITYFVINTQMLYNLFIYMIDALATDMLNFSSTDLFGDCMRKFSIWERMDCMVDTVIGIQISSITAPGFQGFNHKFGGEMMQRGLIGTFFHLMKSSSFGFVIGLMGFLYIYALLFFLVRVLLAFLMAFLALTLIMMIGPIFIPLVMFRATKQYFDKWVGLIISSCLQPIVLVAFITFAVAGLDLVMFSGPTSVIRVIAGNAATQQGFNISAYVAPFLQKDAAALWASKGEDSQDDFKQAQGVIRGFIDVTKTDCKEQAIGNITTRMRPGAVMGAPPLEGLENLANCARTKVNQFTFKSVDVPLLAARRAPPVDSAMAQQYLQARQARESLAAQGKPANPQVEQQFNQASQVLEKKMTQELFVSSVVALMMMFLMFALMRVVPVIANDLTGEFRFTPSFFSTASGGLAQKLAQSASGAARANVSGGT